MHECPLTGYYLPRLVETGQYIKPTAYDVKAFTKYDMDYMSAGVDIFRNPFEIAQLCISEEELDKSIRKQEREMRMRGLIESEEPQEEIGQLTLF